jgi:hypothetical protein
MQCTTTVQLARAHLPGRRHQQPSASEHRALNGMAFVDTALRH